MQSKYGAGQDRYCYPNSYVLINLLDIRDADELELVEAEFTLSRYLEFSSTTTSIEQFTFSHFKRLHHHLFQDIYDWAGTMRDIDISKGSTRFCTCSRIAPEAAKIFNQIRALADLKGEKQLICELAILFCDINMLHPFRDGNGRTQRFFFEELLFCLGYDIKWPIITKEEWIAANIAGINGQFNLIATIITRAISRTSGS
jgi:cell filamentation protein